MPLRVETCVASHIGDRVEQQDRVDHFSHPRRPGMLMAALADGMGGHSGGGIAAEQLIVKARQNLADYAPQTESPGDCLEADLPRHGRITAAQAEKHPHRPALMSCLGGSDPPRVARGGADRLVAGDAFLLCSDGLWAYFSNGELASIIARQSARQAAEELVGLARERAKGHGDNISLALVKLVEA